MKKLIYILFLISTFGFSQTKPSRFPGIQDDNKTVGTNTTFPVVTQNPTTGVYEKVPRNYFATQLQLSNVKTLINTTTGNDTDSALIINSIPFYANKNSGIYQVKIGERIGLNNNGVLFASGYNIGNNNQSKIIGFGTYIGNDANGKVIGFGSDIFANSNKFTIGFGEKIGLSSNANLIAFGNNIGDYSIGNSVISFGDYNAIDASGDFLCAIGSNIGNSIRGSFNTGLGFDCLRALNGNNSVGIGNRNIVSNFSDTYGDNLVAIGENNILVTNSGINLGNNLVSIGQNNIYNSTGNELVSIGKDNIKGSTGSELVAIGNNNINENSGSNLIIIGKDNLFNNTFSNIIALGNSCKPDNNKQFVLSANDTNGSFKINLDILNSVTVNPPSSSGTLAILTDIPAPISIATKNTNGLMSNIDKVKLDNLLENNENNQTYFTDFVGNEGTVFSSSAGIGGGQANFFATEINHNGILRFIQNNANAGYSFTTPISNIQISGNEIFTAIFRPQTFNTVTFRAGFHNSVTPTDASNGIYFEYTNSGNIFFKTAINNIRSTSSSIATLLVNNWYKLKITVNSNATSVTGEVYDSLGVLIGSQILTTNIPKLARTQVGAGVIATRVTAGTGVPLIDLDYVKFTLKAIR